MKMAYVTSCFSHNSLCNNLSVVHLFIKTIKVHLISFLIHLKSIFYWNGINIKVSLYCIYSLDVNFTV